MPREGGNASRRNRGILQMADDAPHPNGSPSFWRFRRKARPSNLQAADESADSVGLYVSGNQAFLAHVRAGRGRLPTISRHLTATLDPHPAAANRQLRELLLEMGNGRLPRHLWTCIQSPGMVLQSLRIPKVRPSAMVSAAFWTLKKERNLQTENTVFDIEMLRSLEEEGSPRLELLAVAVPKEELDDHQQFNAELGSQAIGVTPPVFAFRNFLRLGFPALSRQPCAILFINDASSDVFVFDAGQILAVRTLRTGLDSLRDTIVQTLDIDNADPRVGACLALLAGETPDPAIFGDETPPTADDVFSWGRPVARRLARNIQRTLHAFEETIESGGGSGPVFLVAGTITRYERLVQFIGEQIGIQLAPFTPRRSEFLQQLQAPDKTEPPEASGMSLAIGLALAEAYNTPNLLFTFADRLRLQKRNRLTRSLRVAIVIVLVTLVAMTGVLHHFLRMRESQRDRIRETVAIGAQDFDKTSIVQSSEQAMARQRTTRALAEAYFAPAVVAEVAALTPSPISLLEIRLDFPDVREESKASAKTTDRRSDAQRILQGKGDDSGKKGNTLSLQGVILAPRERSDGILAEYLFRLQQSPFFVSPQLLQRRLERVEPGYLVFGDRTLDHLLFFTLEATLETERPKTAEEPPKG